MTAHTLDPIGGIEVNSIEVAERLASAGNEVVLLYTADGTQRRRWDDCTTALVRVPGFFIRPAHPLDLLSALKTVLVARRLRPDVIYLNHPELAPWGILAARASGATLVCHLHHPLPRAGKYRRLVRLLSTGVDRFIAVSDYMRTYWVSAGVPARKVSVVHNGVLESDYPMATSGERATARRALGFDDTTTLYLFAGRLIPEKGLDLLLDAWQLSRLGADRTLIALGDFVESPAGDEYRARIEASDLSECRLVGQVADIHPYLAAADVVVVPSRWDEPFGRVVIEAMSVGRPVVATRSGAIPEILTGEFDRFLVDRESPAALAAAMEAAAVQLASDPELPGRCSEHVRRNFDLNDQAPKITQVLASAADK